MNEGLSKFTKTKELLDEVSQSFCLAKWLQTTLLMQNGTTQSCHHVHCHKIDANELLKNPSALHNTKFKKRMRGYMIAGLHPDECTYCWSLENIDSLSDRIIKSSSYWAKPLIDRVLDAGAFGNIDPSYLEVSFSNVCPLKCLYCSPLSSTTWQDEIKKFGPYKDSKYFGSMSDLAKVDALPFTCQEDSAPYIKAFWKWWPTLRSHLKCFRITGGEPLLHESTWRIFDDLMENSAPNLVLEINSSLCVGEKIVERLIENANKLQGKVKEFLLHISIDTIGEQAEYIRFGLSLPRFENNIACFLRESKGSIKLNYMITVNALSIVGIKALLSKIIEQRKKYPHVSINIDLPHLRNPSFLSVQILDESFKKHFESVLDFMRANNDSGYGFTDISAAKFERIYRWAFDPCIDKASQNQARKDFYIFLKESDIRKNTNFEKVFPEYGNFWHKCRTCCG